MESVLENKLVSSYKEEMISFIDSHPEYFDEAIQLAISDKQPYSWRAAYLLWSCMKENDVRIQKHIPAIVKSIKNKKDGHQRELLKILYKMKISKKFEGQIFDICINLWTQINKVPSVRMMAFKFIIKIVKDHHELLDEVNTLTQNHYLETLSPGVKRSIEIMLEDNLQKNSLSEN